jgi:hypothetical protein
VLELHNDNYSKRALPEDTRLLRAAGFDPDGKSYPEWSHLTLRPGRCPLKLVPTFYRMLLVELCCGETSELCKLEHTLPDCLGVRITARHDVLNERTLDMLNFCATEYGFGKHIVVWMSFRCTGGSQLQHINRQRGDPPTHQRCKVGVPQPLHRHPTVRSRRSFARWPPRFGAPPSLRILDRAPIVVLYCGTQLVLMLVRRLYVWAHR